MRNSNRPVASRKGVNMQNASLSRKEIDASEQKGKQNASAVRETLNGAKMTILELTEIVQQRLSWPAEQGQRLNVTELLKQERESDAKRSDCDELLKHWLKDSYEKKPTCAAQSAEGKTESEKIESVLLGSALLGSPLGLAMQQRFTIPGVLVSKSKRGKNTNAGASK
ncbi:MAG: hypothetical protein LQ350_000369 [Teloschistes chrysophthalmus]|nr:MAG: hypothetical protein LQ350_000369 [Niorma chrysophthalma]